MKREDIKNVCAIVDIPEKKFENKGDIFCISKRKDGIDMRIRNYFISSNVIKNLFENGYNVYYSILGTLVIY